MNTTAFFDPPIEAVIFDCDGTLIDSEPLALAALARELKVLGIAVGGHEALLTFKGHSMSRSLEMVEQRYGLTLPDGFEARLRVSTALVFRQELQAMPGALAMLQGLALRYCIASNGPRSKMELTLEITGLLPLFDGRIFSAYEVGSFKPDPGIFLHAAAAMGVAPGRCVVVEDSVAGIQAGLAAGMSVYVLRSPEALPHELAARVHTIDHLSELTSAVWNRNAAEKGE